MAQSQTHQETPTSQDQATPTDHCRNDERYCRGDSYCACQCDVCKRGYFSKGVNISEEQERTTLPGLYHGNSVDFAGKPALNDKGELKLFGMAYSVGWDIPTLWAIDQDNHCWANDAYGGVLCQITVDQLMNELVDDEADKARARITLGLKPAAPMWMRAARGAGWSPPFGFKEDDYEW